MRFLLLILALAYAAQPPGLCICHLSEQLADFLNGETPACPDDHEEGDCPCAKKVFTAEAPQATSLPTTMALALPAADADLECLDPSHDPELFFSPDAVDSPLYLTLRALRI